MYRIYIALEVLRKTVAEIALKGKKKKGEKNYASFFNASQPYSDTEIIESTSQFWFFTRVHHLRLRNVRSIATARHTREKNRRKIIPNLSKFFPMPVFRILSSERTSAKGKVKN